MSKSTTLGLEENIESALSYVLGPFTGIAFLVLEKENKNVRFHAMQSTVYIGILMVLEVILNMLYWVPIIGLMAGLANWVLGIIIFVSIVYLAFMAFQGNMFKIPYIGDSVWEKTNK